MSLFLKQFSTHSEYEAYIASEDKVLPNVSICTTEGDVHYNPWVETRVVAKYNVTSPGTIRIINSTRVFSSIEIDGVVQPSVITHYYFITTGEHTIKYTLTDPTSIGENTFVECNNLTSIVIPDSVTTIGNYVFNRCSGLTSCTIGSGVTSIGDWAFYQCSGLTSITIPNSVTSIGSNAIYQCTSLTSINIPDSVTNIGFFGIAYCSGLTSCTISNGITNLSDGVFYSCTGLTSINIPSGVTSIGENTFGNCTSLISIKSNATTAPTIQSNTFRNIKTGGTLTVPIGSSGYDTWMQNAQYYLGLYGWTKVEQQ